MSVIRNPGAVYRAHPDHNERLLAVHRDNLAKAKAAYDETQRVCSEIVPGSTGYGGNHDDGGFYVSGLVVDDYARVGEIDADMPAGLRWDTKAKGGAKVLVPRMKNNEGKALRKRLDALGFQPVSLGAVSNIVTIGDGTNRWFVSAIVEEIHGVLYATYFHPVDDRKFGERPSDRERVESDPAWEPIPLSEFYAAREAAGR